jgi:hypothetical protein
MTPTAIIKYEKDWRKRDDGREQKKWNKPKNKLNNIASAMAPVLCDRKPLCATTRSDWRNDGK